MMKQIVAVVFLLGLISLPLMAQDYPRAEVFAGYQFTHLGGSGTDINANGWDASLTGNFNHWLGLTADFSGAYKTLDGVSANVYTYTGGPVVSLNSGGTVNPFVHALFGGTRIGASISGLGSDSQNGFTTMLGGGVDLKVNRLLAVRGQADWVFYRFSGDSESKNVRIATGLVLRF